MMATPSTNGGADAAALGTPLRPITNLVERFHNSVVQ